MAKKTSLPRTIYVVRQEEKGEEPFFLADADLHTIVSAANESPAVVGAYQLMGETKYRETVEVVR